MTTQTSNTSSSIMTLFFYCQALSPPRKHQKFPGAPLARFSSHRSLLLIIKTTRQHLSFWWLLALVAEEMTAVLSTICSHDCLQLSFSPSFHGWLCAPLLPLHHPVSPGTASSRVCMLQTAVKCSAGQSIVATVVSTNFCCFLGST